MSEQIPNLIVLSFGVDHFVVTTTPNALVFNKINSKIVDKQKIDSASLNAATLESITVPFSNYNEVQTLKTKLQNAYQVNTFEFKDFLFNFQTYSRAHVDHLLDSLSYIEKFMPRQYII